MAKLKYALVGTGGRAQMFIDSIARDYSDRAELVAFCDCNQTRMAYANKQLVAKYGLAPLPLYKAEQFDAMITERQPDIVIVATIDNTHHTYIIRAMELGCDVICEKPMTVDEQKCQAVFEAISRTGRDLRVTFNLRYTPYASKVKELILAGTIGEVFSVHFEWMLNIHHGADYFRRWHREKDKSGGLLVHKSTHHFDLVNFWLGSEPETVYAQGGLRFYGRENAERRGVNARYDRAYGSVEARNDPFAIHLEDDEHLREMYLHAEHEDGYYRDQSVFGEGITIEDTLAVLVRYRNQALLTYSLNAYLPYEGFRAVLNGSKGRIEINLVEATQPIHSAPSEHDSHTLDKTIKVFPMFNEPYVVAIEEGVGGHGGGDRAMLRDIFAEKGEDRLGRSASHVDGAMSVLIGIAGNHSIASGLPERIDELVNAQLNF